MNQPAPTFPADIQWESAGTSRIPFMAYMGDEQHKKELERFFYRKHWCYVGLEAEIPNAGDFKRTVVGERSVVMVRDADDGISVVENVCAPPWHAVLQGTAWEQKRVCLSLSSVELHPQG